MPAEDLANQPLRTVPLHGAADPARHGDAQPRTPCPVAHHEQDEIGRRDPLTLVVDALIFAALADPILGTETFARGQTVRRLRPLARRRFSTRRPFLVLMRARKPCVLRRRRLFG